MDHTQFTTDYTNVHIHSALPFLLHHFLQIWVSCPHNGSGFYGLKDEINDTLSRDHFQSSLSSGADLTATYARTGFLGFIVKSDKTDQYGGWVNLQFNIASSPVLPPLFSSLQQPVCRWVSGRESQYSWFPIPASGP